MKNASKGKRRLWKYFSLETKDSRNIKKFFVSLENLHNSVNILSTKGFLLFASMKKFYEWSLKLNKCWSGHLRKERKVSWKKHCIFQCCKCYVIQKSLIWKLEIELGRFSIFSKSIKKFVIFGKAFKLFPKAVKAFQIFLRAFDSFLKMLFTPTWTCYHKLSKAFWKSFKIVTNVFKNRGKWSSLKNL